MAAKTVPNEAPLSHGTRAKFDVRIGNGEKMRRPDAIMREDEICASEMLRVLANPLSFDLPDPPRFAEFLRRDPDRRFADVTTCVLAFMSWRGRSISPQKRIRRLGRSYA